MFGATPEEAAQYEQMCIDQGGNIEYDFVTGQTICHLPEGGLSSWYTEGEEPVQYASRGLKWWHKVTIGALGAGAGYMLLKNRMSTPAAVGVGAAVAVIPVLAFAPGGWFRKGGVAGTAIYEFKR